jgi:hypothetical protein
MILAASLALWQSYCFLHLTPPERTSLVSRLVTPDGSVPWAFRLQLSSLPVGSKTPFALFGLPSPLRMTSWLLTSRPHCNLSTVSPKFSPPVCYQLSLAWGYSLLWAHLHPAPRLPSLVSPLVWALPVGTGWYWASPVKPACLNLNASVLTF